MSANYERKQKQRSIMGITAGAEDVKYQAKYRELKKKVKEIESVSHAQYGAVLRTHWRFSVIVLSPD